MRPTCLLNNKIEKLPVVDNDGKLVGLITYKDITKVQDHPERLQGQQGPSARSRRRRRHRRYDGACGRARRARTWTPSSSTTAHGHSANIVSACCDGSRPSIPTLDVVVGNIATAEAAQMPDRRRRRRRQGRHRSRIDLHDARHRRAWAFPSSRPSTTCASAAARHGRSRDRRRRTALFGRYRQGAGRRRPTAVMIGSMFAGAEESPGDTIIYNGRKFKSYRGMGSLDAMQAGFGRPLFPGRRGQHQQARSRRDRGARAVSRVRSAETVYQLIGGHPRRHGLLRRDGHRDAQTGPVHPHHRQLGVMLESHPHDVTITSEAPNYSSEH